MQAEKLAKQTAFHIHDTFLFLKESIFRLNMATARVIFVFHNVWLVSFLPNNRKSAANKSSAN